MIAGRALRRNVIATFSRCYSESIGQRQGSQSGNKSTPPPPSNVSEAPGLSNAVINPSTEPVGPNVDPNKSGAYKSPEYYQYHTMSYYEAEVEMFRFRIPQPSALTKK